MGLYSLRDANRSVRIAALLFVVMLGCAHVFAFLMVREYTGLTPERLRDAYRPPAVSEEALPSESRAQESVLDLGTLPETEHRVSTALLIQDSHIHILIFAVVAAFEALIVLGLGWPAWWRDTVIVAAFGSGLLDFTGQWLMKAGFGRFAWLTLAAGWTMAAAYLIVLGGTLRALFPWTQDAQRSAK